MSYTQIGDFRKTRGVKFNMYATGSIMGKHLNGDSVAVFSYAAVLPVYVVTAMLNVKSLILHLSRYDAVDELGTDSLDAVGKALNESKAWQAAVEKGKELEEDVATRTV